MNLPVIEIRNLKSAYGDQLVLQEVNLQIPANEITAILGTSGCGKTTLLKHMIGLLKPLEGEIQILGKSILELDENELNDVLKKAGVLFQSGALLNSISLADNIAIPLEQHTNLSKDMIEFIIKQKLELVGLSHAYHYLPGELSGGMRKRAALARAIALDPVILFADEPGAGLDPVTAASLDQLLLSLKEKLGMTLVMVTHETASIKRIADRIIYLGKNRVLFSGTLREALESDIPALITFFNSDSSQKSKA
ncbi:MAG: ATP-binding cassette domain-containing protein [Calditrichaceae bacterium]|nr:ATP-binding cassette domain-containing protein [Calditrichaceae bacterium]RQV93603.1 MAG: ATP-binding cassette domain-containing protein [Calditrichota bacterium]